MKIVHITDCTAVGGAANAARRLSAALTHLGFESTMLVRTTSLGTSESAIVTRGDRDHLFPYVRSAIDRQYRELNRTSLTNTHFSLYLDGADVSEYESVRRADIVHLHWTASFQTPADVARLLEMKPVVWTLHDLAPLTGGCHFPAGCEEYVRECERCPQLERDPFSITATTLGDKKALWSGHRMAFVSPSRWIAERAGRSAVTQSMTAPVVHIPYGIDTTVFRPSPKRFARRALGVPERGVHVLCGANYNSETRKGLGLLGRVLARCNADLDVSSRGLKVVSVGEPALDLGGLEGVEVHHLGRVAGDDRMALAYAAADIFVLPSLEDNLPVMLLESLSCATPVIAFGAGGIGEVLEDDVCGRVVPAGDERAMSAAISSLLRNPERLEQMGRRGRARIESDFAAPEIARRHAGLYGRLAVDGVEPLADGTSARRLAVTGIDRVLPRWSAACLARELSSAEQRIATLTDELRSTSAAMETLRVEVAAELALVHRIAAERNAVIDRLQRDAQEQERVTRGLSVMLEEQLTEIALVHRVAAEREELIDVLQRAAHEGARHDDLRDTVERQQAEITLLQGVAAEREALIQLLQSAAEERAQLIDDLTAAIAKQRAIIALGEGAAAGRSAFERARAVATRLAGLVRLRHWWSQKVPPLLFVVYLELLRRHAVPSTSLAAICIFVLCVSCVAAYGHVLNDWCDIAVDERAGKMNAVRHLSVRRRALVCATLLVAAFGLLAPFAHAWPARLALVLNVLWPTLYSIPGVRLKERGVLGVLGDAAGSHITPTIFAFTLVDVFLPSPANGVVVAAALLWASALGIKGILHHQISDRANDEKSGIATFAAALELRTLPGRLAAFNAFVELPISVFLVAAVATFCPLAVAALVLYVALESAKHALGFEFALGSEEHLRRPSVPFANEMFYTFWLPLSASLQLAANQITLGWLPVVHVLLFRTQGIVQWHDARRVLQHFKARFARESTGLRP